MLGSALLLLLLTDDVSLPAPQAPLSAQPSVAKASEANTSPPPVTNAFAARPLSFELRLGIATPTGALGVAVEYSLLAPLAVGCGVGSNALGWEPACWLRGRWVTEPSEAYTLSTGLGTSRYDSGETKLEDLLYPFIGEVHASGSSNFKFQHAAWWSSDIGYEYRQQADVFRAFIGVAVLLNPGEASTFSATATQAAASPLDATGYVGFGFGFAP
ncbi:MAG TPA: hypothetical protein VIK01_27110 [Polyangiaceae bacterium]